jgi:hypothetical protein
VSDLLTRKTARISKCGTYRYRLTRCWGDAPMLPFVMLNPSTADADLDDPTIRRCMSFARREKMGGIVVSNLYALRATDPQRLKEVNDPFGPGNQDALSEIGTDAVAYNVPIVCAWGAHGTLLSTYQACDDLKKHGARLVCLGKTKEGFPRHPLYVRGDQPLIPFP